MKPLLIALTLLSFASPSFAAYDDISLKRRGRIFGYAAAVRCFTRLGTITEQQGRQLLSKRTNRYERAYLNQRHVKQLVTSFNREVMNSRNCTVSSKAALRRWSNSNENLIRR